MTLRITNKYFFQVAQLAQDRAELQTKLEQLQLLVKKVVVAEEAEEAAEEQADVEERDTSQNREKILELLSEIGSDSSQMVARCEGFQPWFWDNCEGKVMTV